MSKRAAAVFLILAALWWFLPAYGVAAEEQDGVHWLTYAQGVEQQQKSRKPMLLFFHLTYCYRCQEMERKVYRKPDVYHLLNREFVPVMIDVDADKTLKEKFGIKFVPTHIFLAPDGSIIKRFEDTVSKDRFMELLHDVEASASGGKTGSSRQ